MPRHDLVAVSPSPPLRAFISHYWLSLDNQDEVYEVLPDGAVDVVVSQCGGSTHARAYGTSTSRTVVALEQRTHYLGIRFRPGQSRHFMLAAANELTDRYEPSAGLLSFSLDRVLENAFGIDVFRHIDTILERHVAARRPAFGRLEEVIASMDASHGRIPVSATADLFGTSRRQLERVFAEAVGISPKLYCSIVRFRHAAERIQRGREPLSSVAIESGYSDQSHMNHDFRRFAHASPAAYAKNHVAFLQEAASGPA